VGPGNRGAEEVTLDFGAANAGERIELLLRLDPLCCRFNTEFSAEAGHGAHNRAAVTALAKITNERLVYLDTIEWEAS
jgi:hypothetical protein